MKIEDTMNGFDIIWDLGRRCTYECTYCPPHRNNKTSPLVTFEDLKKSMTFLDEYVRIYEDMRGKQYKRRKLSFTGGEPTVHTGFLKFANYIKETYGERYTIGITTNGLFTKRQAELYKDFAGTISYHAEGTPAEKKLVIDNIYLIKHWQVNVMFHKDYFDECIKLCEDLEEAGIKYIPRRIGDDGNDQSSIRNGYTHVYTEFQEDYFAEHWRKKNEKKEGKKEEVDLDQVYVNADKKGGSNGQKKEAIVKAYTNPIKSNTVEEVSQTDIEESLGGVGTVGTSAYKKQKETQVLEKAKDDTEVTVTTYPSLMKDEDKKTRKSQGRMCCGGRDFCLTTSDEPEGKLSTYVDNTNFFGYSCLVNHYFLYINQESRDIYHHQTCMVNLDNDVAPIGNLDESDKILERLQGYVAEKKMPVITCPKTFCGCGMCVDKMDSSYDIKEHNFGITKVDLIPNVLKASKDTRTITVRNRMESIDDKLYIQNLNVR